MTAVWLIARRDIEWYFKTWLGYIVAAVVLAFFGIIYNAFGLGSLSGAEKLSAQVLKDFFYFGAGIVFAASLLISFPSFAREREHGTLVLLLSAPVKEWQVALGKFLASYIIVALVILASFYMPLMVGLEGKISFGHVMAGYSGLLALAAACVAVCVFASAVSPNQIVAALLGLVMLGTLFLLYWLVRVAEPPISNIIAYLDLYYEHGTQYSRGILRSSDCVYYLSLTAVFLIASAKVIRSRRWAA